MRKFYPITLATLISFFAISCNQEELIFPTPNEKKKAEYVTIEELLATPTILESNDGYATLYIVSEEKWTLSSSEEWCVLPSSEGSMYKQVSIIHSANPWNVDRNALLKFTMTDSGEEYYINVTQEAAPTSISITEEEFLFSVGGGTAEVNLNTNAYRWSAELIDEDDIPISWCTMDVNSGSGSTQFNLETNGNTTGGLLNAYLVFTMGDESYKVPVRQLSSFEAAAITLDADDNFAINWESVIGVDKYTVIISDQSDFSNIIKNIEIVAGSESFDLNTIVYDTPYVGMIYVKLSAHMLVEGVDLTKDSNVVSAHNLFDDASGSGVAGDEYIVTKPRHLRNIGQHLGYHYKQTADINLAGIDLKPIHITLDVGTSEYRGQFIGVYDAGKGRVVDPVTGRTSEQYEISNWTYKDKDKKYCGLFARVGAGGIVRNICMRNVQLEGKFVIGAIVGQCSGEIVNCSVVGGGSRIHGDNGNGEFAEVGGIAGRMYRSGALRYCVNNAEITAESGGIAGIVGRYIGGGNTVEIENCTNNGNVRSTKLTPLGGIVAHINEDGGFSTSVAKLTRCVNNGNISSPMDNNQVGGIVGRTFEVSLKIRESCNTGNVTAHGSAGGIVGRMGGRDCEFIDCFNSGTIESTGQISSLRNSCASGILPTALPGTKNSLTIINCHNVGELRSKIASQKNAIVHYIQPTSPIQKIDLRSCYALDKDGYRQSNSSDEFMINPLQYHNINDSQMKQQSSFSGWDFSNIWELTNGQYPTLRNVIK